MPVDALTAVRSGPLLPWWGIALLAVGVAAVAYGASLPRVRSRWVWLLPEVVAFGALALLHLLFFWQPYRSGAVVPKGGGDLASFFYPIHAFAAREVQDGRLPFWNPHLFSGAPHLANFQAGMLYPPNLMAYLLFNPFDYAALELLVLLHFLLASWGAYWLARVYGIPRAGAVLTGAIYAYSGFMVAHLGHYPMLATAAWAPWLLAAVVATIRRDSWPIALLGALALTNAVLAGHQPILLFTLTVVVAVALFELWRDSGFGTRHSGESSVDGELTSPLCHPERQRRISPQTGDQVAEERSFAAAQDDKERGRDDRREYTRFINALLPHLTKLGVMVILAFGLAAPAIFPMLELTGRTVRSGLEYADASQYSVRPVALVHLLLPTVFGSNPTDYWGGFSNTEIWGYTGVLAIVLALFGLLVRPSRTRLFWGATAIVALLFLLGPFASLHGWAYAFLPGYDRIRGAGRAYMFVDLSVALLAGWGLAALLRERWPVRQVAYLKWGVVGLAGALLLVVGLLVPLLLVNVVSDPEMYNRPVIALDNALLLAVWLGLGLIVATAIWRGKLRGSGLVLAVFVVVLLDLFHATSPFNPTTDDVLVDFQHPEAIAFLRERVAVDGPFRIEVVTPEWQPNTAQLVGLDEIGGLVDPLALADYDDYLARARADRSSDTYRNLNVRYLIADVDQVAPPGYEEVLRTETGLMILEVPESRPRAWLADSDVSISVERSSPNSLTLTLPAESPGGDVVISQTDYSGWSAQIDGRDLDLNTYDGVLQTVTVPSGQQTVELTFRPTNWMLYIVIAALSAVGWLVAFGLTLAGWRRRSIVSA